VLLVVLAITAAALLMLGLAFFDQGKPADIALLLWFFTILFVLRVAGQILVAVRPRRWLPPMGQWNLVPYPILLPIQILFIAVMVWINMSFTLNVGIATIESPDSGSFLIVFSAFYALVMVIRYAVRMSRRPDQRWFGGTIPIVFHIVLASYLYTLGCFYGST
jgi:hypothetical protein